MYLANLGIQTERDGTLSLNSTRFNAALDADPDLLNVVFSRFIRATTTTSLPLAQQLPPTPGSYSFSYTVGSDATLDDQTITGSANDNGNMILQVQEERLKTSPSAYCQIKIRQGLCALVKA